MKKFISILVVLSALMWGGAAFAQTCMLLRPDGGNCVKVERLSDERAMGDAQNHRFRVTNSCAMTLQISYQSHGKKTLFVPGNKSEMIYTAIGDEEPSGIQVQCNPGQARQGENPHQAYKGISQAEMNRLSTLPRADVAAYLRIHKLPPSETESCPASRAECAFRTKYSLVAPTPEPRHVTNSQATAHTRPSPKSFDCGPTEHICTSGCIPVGVYCP